MERIESNIVEFKREYTKTLLKDVVAFINTDGGSLFIGIDDDGSIWGVEDVDEVMNQVSNLLSDCILPDVLPFVQIYVEKIENKNVVRVEVFSGTNKPYFISEKGLTPAGVLIRVGSSCKPLSVTEIRKMIIDETGKSFEEGRSVEQNLTFDSIAKEMHVRQLEFSTVQMKTLHFIGEDGLYTNLALLFSEQNPYTIKVAIFQGSNKMIFRDRKEFSGSIMTQLNDCYSYLLLLNKTKAIIKGLYREDIHDYPFEALREALLNSIIHRDYSFSASTIINVFDDHIEFCSLGGLVSGLTLEAAMLGVSQSRNPYVAAVFYRMKLVESYGTGINKIQTSYGNFSKKPVFETAEGAFLVKLFNVNEISIEEENTAKKRQRNDFDSVKKNIYSYLQENEDITRKEVENLFDIGTTKACKVLDSLCEDGLIVREGKGNQSFYILADE